MQLSLPHSCNTGAYVIVHTFFSFRSWTKFSSCRILLCTVEISCLLLSILWFKSFLHTHTHTHTHEHTQHTYTHTQHTYTHTHTHTHQHTHTTHIHTYAHTHTHTQHTSHSFKPWGYLSCSKNTHTLWPYYYLIQCDYTIPPTDTEESHSILTYVFICASCNSLFTVT